MPKPQQTLWRTLNTGRVLVIYGTTEGHTREVAAYIADLIRAEGLEAEIADSAAEPKLSGAWSAFIIGASVHQAQHQTTVRELVKANLPLFELVPSAFFSVSLAAAVQSPARQAEAQGYLEAFLKDTGWHPCLTLSLAGALRHTEYGAYETLVLDLLAYQLGGGTVVAHDVVYTDWNAVETFVREFLIEVASVPKTPPKEGKAKRLTDLPDDDLSDWR